MRTTLVIPDDVYREVKVTAAREGITVTSFIEQSLRDALDRSRLRAEVRLPVLPQSGGVRAGVDLRDNVAVRDILEGEA
ncbi:MAG: hypothetical protein RL347_2245 [Actinomycetota bacterium]|jgi:hypothetical protein